MQLATPDGGIIAEVWQFRPDGFVSWTRDSGTYAIIGDTVILPGRTPSDLTMRLVVRGDSMQLLEWKEFVLHRTK